MAKKLLLVGLLFVSLALAGVATAAEIQGVTKDTIKIGQWGPQTGPAALWGAVARGTGLYFKLLNDEGGINGRKIEYFIRDDAYQPSRTKAIAKDLWENEKVWGFASGVGTSPGLAVMPYIEQFNIPWVGMATGSRHWAIPPKKTVFAVYPWYSTEVRAMVRYAVKELGKKKIGFVYTNDDYGKGGMEPGVDELKKLGMEPAAVIPTEVSDTDLQSHVLKLKEAGADCVVLWLLPKQAIITVGTGAKMGYRPQWMASSTLSDTALMFKLSKGLWKGVINANFAELPDSDNPLMAKYRAAWKKYEPKERWGVFYYAGIGFVEPMVEGIKRCGDDLSWQNFVKSMESIKDFQGIMGKVTFGPDRRQGMMEIFLSRVNSKGMSDRLTEWMQIEE
jgi:ABC-type branched-subunit amino acid transport system substrate-binding protein